MPGPVVGHGLPRWTSPQPLAQASTGGPDEDVA